MDTLHPPLHPPAYPHRTQPGILVAGSSPTLSRLNLTGCAADAAAPAASDAAAAFAAPGTGGGLSVSNGSPTVTDCDFWRAEA